MTRLIDLPAYRRVWTAATISSFGTYITTLALQVLAAITLRANAFQLGLINAARWLPYALFGLVVGVITDRHRRRPILVGTDFGRGATLCLIPILYAVGWLTIWSLIAIVFVFGTLSLFFDAADQSFLPRVVPPALLPTAFARLDQSDGAAQAVGPVLAAGLVRAVGAPLAVLVDAVTYVASGLVLTGVRVVEPTPRPAARRVWTELREGVAWVYRHRMLAPMAISGHAWFVFSGMMSTVYVLLVLDAPAGGGLGLGTFDLGVSYAFAGLGAVLGGVFTGPAGRRPGPGWTSVLSHLAMPFVWLPVVLVRSGPIAVVALCATQFLFWVLIVIGGGNELAYRNAVTPDRLQGRMNTTMRSINRGAVVVGAPVGGLIAVATTYRTALWIGIAGMAAAATGLALSPLRHARMSDAIGSTDGELATLGPSA
jgi:MFS family permease